MGTVTIDATSIRNMIDSALGYCARLSRLDSHQEALGAIHNGDCSVCGYLRCEPRVPLPRKCFDLPGAPRGEQTRIYVALHGGARPGVT